MKETITKDSGMECRRANTNAFMNQCVNRQKKNMRDCFINMPFYTKGLLILILLMQTVPVSYASPGYKNHINYCHGFDNPNGVDLPDIVGYTMGEVMTKCESQCNSYDRFECIYMYSTVNQSFDDPYQNAHVIQYHGITELTDTIMNTIKTGAFMSSFHYECLPGFIQTSDVRTTEYPVIDCVGVSYSLLADTPPKECADKDNPLEGNPCNPATGNKIQTEIDIVSAKSFGLSFKRYYSSLSSHNSANNLAPGWRHSYERSLNEGMRAIPLAMPSQTNQSGLYNTPEEACVNGWQELSGTVYSGALSAATASLLSNQDCSIELNGKTAAIFKIRAHADELYVPMPVPQATDSLVTLSRKNGSIHYFENNNGTWQTVLSSGVSLTVNNDEWTFTDKDGSKEIYDAIGNLIRIIDLYGHTQTLTYDSNNLLTRVETNTGDFLQFTYDTEQRISSITNQSGGIWGYRYDTNSNLEFVDYPDNTTRQYHYEDASFPHHLTGITDENGNRFATWAYDAKGRALSSEHAGGVEKVQFSYNSNGTTTVIGVLGALRTYHFDLVQGDLKVTHIEGDRCTTCPSGGIQAYSYDANGNIASKTDWNGVTTTYTYDMDRNLELARTEAVGTLQERTITTEWHPQFRLPTKIKEPNRITEYTYDGQGRQLTSKVSSNQ